MLEWLLRLLPLVLSLRIWGGAGGGPSPFPDPGVLFWTIGSGWNGRTVYEGKPWLYLTWGECGLAGHQ